MSKLMQSLERKAARFLRSRGYLVGDDQSVDFTLARRMKLFASFDIDIVLDVGANTGQYASQLRKLGFDRTIVSFEPLTSAFVALKRRALDDPNWRVVQVGLGARDETTTINIAGNSVSSSLLGMLPAHEQSAPQSAYVGTEEIRIRSLDGIMDELGLAEGNIWLKIDTQGFEMEVLRGASAALARIDTIQVELSLVSLYENGPLYDEVMGALTGKGYTLVSVEPGHSDPRSGQLLQVDGIFHRFPGTVPGGFQPNRHTSAR